MWHYESIFICRGASGGGDSAEALDSSAPTTILFLEALSAQNILAHVWSMLAVYVYPRVTVPFILGDPLQKPLDFLVPSSLTMYIQINGKKFASEGILVRLLNIH